MQPRTSDGDECLEVGFEFFVPRGEAAEVFESREAAFDAVSLFIEVFIVLALLLAIGFRRDDRDGTHRFDMLDDRIGVVALVGQHVLGRSLSQQDDGLRAVVHLPCGHGEVHRQPPLVGQQMDLRGQASSGTPQSLVLAPFLRPVAACWCARTMVESIIRY